MMSLLALRAEHLAHFSTSVRMMTALRNEKESVCGFQLFNTLFFVDHGFTVLSPVAFIFTKYTKWIY
jgi:hypothetical protein